MIFKFRGRAYKWRMTNWQEILLAVLFFMGLGCSIHW